MNMREKLIRLSVLKQGDWFSIYQVLSEDISLNKNEAAITNLNLNELCLVSAVTILDKNYPEAFREMDMPPFVLFYRGNLKQLKQNKIGIIVGQHLSNYGAEAYQKMIYPLLEEGCVIIGGCHLESEGLVYSLARKGNYIDVLSTGLNGACPKRNHEHDKERLILTEYPLHERSTRRQYYRSYRLIQQLSDALIVIELSGGDRRLTDLKQTLSDGKSIFALPDHYNAANSKGSLLLINEGAHCFINYIDVLKALESES